MREVVEQIAVSLDVVNSETGELFPVQGVNTKSLKYYTIKRLNFKGSIMDLFTFQSQLCKSSRDIELFRDILFEVDKCNELRINITKFSDRSKVSRQRVTKFLSDSVKCGFMKKPDRGVYVVNPYTFKAKGANNETIEQVQQAWATL